MLLLRRSRPLVLGVLLLIAGCSCGADDRPSEVAPGEGQRLGDRERLAPGAMAGSNQAPRSITIDETPRPSGVERSRFFVLGFTTETLVDGELPPGIPPSFFWQSPELSTEEWPVSMDAPLPPEFALFAVRDVNGDGHPGPGDRRSSTPVVISAGSEEVVSFVVGRGFVPTRGDEEDTASDPNIRLAPEGKELLERKVTLLPPSSSDSTMTSGVLVVGFEESQLEADAPGKAYLPVYAWRQEARELAFPQDLEVRMPEGLALFAVLDRDDNGRMSEGDLRSERFGSERPLAQQFEVRSSVSVQHGSPSNIQISPAGEELFSREVALVRTPLSGARMTSGVLIVGFEASQLRDGAPAPREAHRPAYAWRKEAEALSFPSEFDVWLPQGLALFVVLDRDGDGRMSAGDLRSDRFGSETPLPAVFRVGVTATLDASSTDGASGDNIRSSPQGKELFDRKVTLLAPPPPHHKADAGLLVLGFEESQLDGGAPATDHLPVYVWRQERGPLAWPTRLDVPLPEGLALFAVLDLDGDGRMGGQDLRSGRFGSERPLPAELRVRTAVPLDSTATSDRSGLNVRLAPEGQDLHDRDVTLLLPPRSDRKVNSGVLVLGFQESQLEGDAPGEMFLPVYAWRQEARDLAFPSALEVRMPEGLALFAVLDRDDNGRMSEGDLRSARFGSERPLSRSFKVRTDVPVQHSAPANIEISHAAAQLYRRKLRLVAPRRSASELSAAVLVQGFEESQLEGDAPAAGKVHRPVYAWRQELKSLVFPAELEVWLPEGLALFVVLDKDDDGRMSDGDLRSARFGRERPLPLELELRADVPLDSSSTSDTSESNVRLSPRGKELQDREITLLPPPLPGETVSAGVLVLGFEESQLDGEAPGKQHLPVYVWRQERKELTFPSQVSVALPEGLALIAVLDMDGDGRMGADDFRSAPFGREASLPKKLSVRTDVSLRDRYAPSQRAGDAERVISEGGGAAVARSLEIRVVDPVPASWKSPLMIVGFPPEVLTEGFPSRGGMHRFFWESTKSVETWPHRQQLDLPSELEYLAVLDRDGNRRPSPGDWSSAPFGPGQSERLEVAIGRTFGPDDDEEDDGGEDDPDGDDDDSGDEDDGEDEELPPEPSGPVVQVGLDRSVEQRMVVDTQPRVPFLRRGSILVAAFPDSEIERGMPQPGATPSFYWRSPELRLDWPLRIDGRLPTAPGQTLFVLLDLDDNGRPSPGDLCSAGVADYRPPEGRQEADFLLDKAYSLSTRLTPSREP